MQKEKQLLKSCDKNNLSSPSVSVGDLPHPMLLFNKDKRPYFRWEAEDPGQRPAGMTPNFMGFTLIELLVVVLIIGILAAVALPQYQVSVHKSRAMRIMPLIDAFDKAEQVYHLANGSYATEVDELDIDMPAGASKQGGNFTFSDGSFCRIATSGSSSIKCWVPVNDGQVILERYLFVLEDLENARTLCWPSDALALGHKICKSLGGRLAPDTTNVYLLD